MPKNFVFYNPEHHQKIVTLLEERAPAAIITATAENPEQVGALYPYPLIVDGDFDIPSLYCRDSVGEVLSRMVGENFHLKIDGERIPSVANNIITRLNPKAEQKVVLTAHIDAYEDTPGASDNASGTVVLLLLAEMLSGYQGQIGIEIAALNGEDHYSAAGQLDYLKRYGGELNRVQLAVNIDDVGYRQGGTAYSCYECPAQLEQTVRQVFAGLSGFTPGDPWFNGDHIIFVQNGVPALAFTSESMPELMRTVTHTALDTPEILEPRKLVEVAASLNALLRSL
jgi:aminopeptidase YwaD